MQLRVRVCVSLLGLGAILAAAETAPVPQFEKDVLPLLTAKCSGCHGPKIHTAGLDLHEISLVLRGSQNGPVVVKGSAKESLLWKRVRDGAMPPGKEKLADADIDLLRRWIDGGAPAAATADAPSPVALGLAISEKDRAFWSFRPLSQTPVPAVRQRDLVRTPVDAFLLSKLEARQLTYSAPAARTTLIRRAYLDLLGIVPDPEIVDAFVADRSEDAFTKVIDQLLASPHFGERFGRYWLDLAGYVDTVGRDVQAAGYKVGAGRWQYRDYVVKAFNQDKPYNQFLREQIAGDELFDWKRSEKYSPQQVEMLTATGFLRTAEDPTDEAERDNPLLRYEVLHQTLDILTSSVMGLTVGCARCHDHKFDPIPQRDYYRLMATLARAYNAEKWTPVLQRVLADVPPAVKESIDRQNKELDDKLKPMQARLDALLLEAAKPLVDEMLPALPEKDRDAVRNAVIVPAPRRTARQRLLAAKLNGVMFNVKTLGARMDEAKRAEAAELESSLLRLENGRQKYNSLECLFDTGAPPETFIHRRGDFESKGAAVEPGGLEVLTRDRFAAKPPNPDSSGRRLALAEWLTKEGTPAASLVARVNVNRLWLELFGQGLVATPENFGTMGARPTDPELLDWLAAEFQRNGWRTKPILRLMLTSRAYQQSALASDYPRKHGPAPEPIDPENSLLWRMRLRRLESEAIRDSMLAVSGTLNLKMGGPAVKTTTQADGMVLVDDTDLADPQDRYRRSLYLVARRRYNLSLLGVFDQPVMSTNATTRGASAVVLQSLMMLNNADVNAQAHHFANRVDQAAGPGAGLEKKLDWAFRYAFSRTPDRQEREWALGLYQRELDRNLTARQDQSSAGREALASICHVLLNSNEFLYRE
jgi:cytochrome c553